MPLPVGGEVKSKGVCPQAVICPILNRVPDTGMVSLAPEVPISLCDAAELQHLTWTVYVKVISSNWL